MDPIPAPLELELALAPSSLAALRRRLALGRVGPLALEWHDRDGILARSGIAVAQTQERGAAAWQARALAPAVIAAAPPLLATAPSLTLLDAPGLPDGLAPVQHFAGRQRTGRAGPVALHLLDGTIGAEGTPAARLTLRGPTAETAALARALVAEAGLHVPHASLAHTALALAGLAVPPPPAGPAVLAAGLSPGDAFARAAGHLAAVLLPLAPRAAAGETGEPVHQMRVALRRLRSLIPLFADAVACPELAALRPALKQLATALGPARDWDVFLSDTGPAVAAAFAHEPAMATLLAAAEAHRSAAYAALAPLLTGPVLHGLVLDVAIAVQTRPWAHDIPGDLAGFTAAQLARRLRPVIRRAAAPHGKDDAALHALRLKTKRLRYAAEIYAPLHPGPPARRFLRRLAALQDALGLLNDGAVAAALMHELAEAGGNALAGGMVRGFVAAHAQGARKAIGRSWRRLRKAARSLPAPPP